MMEEQLEVGTDVGGYRITAAIGRGATGTVYRAEGQGQVVAVKVLHGELADETEIRSRFEREAFATSRIDHPACVATLDIGITEAGRLYLIMEHVEGEALSALLDREKRLAPARALRIARDLAAGLEHAHAASVVHRDIKPANILVATDASGVERAKILDFGLAKLIGEAAIGSEKLTRAGMAIGTPRYMAPEWLSSTEIGPSVDIYALSVVLYEMLAGDTPFSGGDPLEVLRRHATAPVPAMAERAPEAPITRDLEELVGRGLRKEPGDRYLTAGAYRIAIDAAIERQNTDKHTLLMTALPVSTPASPATEATAMPENPTPANAPAKAPAPAAGPRAAATPRPPLPELPRPRQARPVAAGQGPGARARDMALAAARRVRRSRPLSLAIAGGVALLLIAVIAASSDSDPAAADQLSAGLGIDSDGAAAPGAGPSVDEAIDAWRDADLEAGGFAAHSGDKFGATECHSGAVSGLDVTLCAYANPEGAKEGEAKGRESIGTHTGAALAVGARLLIVADRKKVDPSGKSINKLIEAFRKGG